MKTFDEIVAENLVYLRKKSGLTQSEFGEKFNYSDKTVSKWELGTVTPNAETLKQIADFYGISMDYIVSEHTTSKEFNSVINKTVDARNKIILICLSAVVILLIAVTIYVSSIYNMQTADPNKNRWWCVFLWSLPVMSLVAAYLSYRYFHHKTAFIVLASIATWTLLLSAFVTFLYLNVYWYLFFIGIPIQAGLILIGQFNKKK